LNNADCIIDEVRNEYKCLCPIGFTGLRCEVNIDECALEGNRQCSSQGGKCVDQINAYYCDFGATVGLEKETAIPRPCTLEDLSMERQFFEIPSPTMNVFLQCTSENRWTVSRCADMLFWDQELRTCSIERPVQKTGVCKTFPCRNDGVCEDMGDFQFRCECKEGFTGPMCEVEIDFCLESPCGAGRCVSHKGGFNCVCQNNIVDSSCTAVVENPCTATGEYWSHSLSASRYFSCGLGGFAFVRDCPAGEFWQQSVMTCMAPEVIAPQRRMPTMSLFDKAPMRSNSAYGGYSQEVPQFVPRMPESTTMAPRYSRPQFIAPKMTPTPAAPAYGQQMPQMRMPTMPQRAMPRMPTNHY
jgi:hypothetical protein